MKILMQIIRLTEVIIGTNTTTLVSCVLFACGNKNAVYPQFLVRERQFVTTNLLIFIKIKNIKIVFVQQCNTSLGNKMINDIERKEFFEIFLDYWNTIVHRQHFGSMETFVGTCLIFSSVKYYWIAKLNGDLEKILICNFCNELLR